MKQSLINLLPPATLAAVIAFWGLAPQAWVDAPWTIMIVGLAVIAFVQLLDWCSNATRAGASTGRNW